MKTNPNDPVAPETEWIQKDRPWSEYPIGTKAKAIMGGHWERVKRGWKWHLGDTFPNPGGDASGMVCIPAALNETSTSKP